jgi:hypothetical protein
MNRGNGKVVLFNQIFSLSFRPPFRCAFSPLIQTETVHNDIKTLTLSTINRKSVTS